MVRELVLWKSGVPIFRPSGGKGREQISAKAMSSSWTKNESSYIYLQLGERDVCLKYKIENYGCFIDVENIEERFDPIVVTFLLFAMVNGCDFRSEYPISESLYYQLTYSLIPQLVAANPDKAHSIKIYAPIAGDIQGKENWIGTGISCGVDSYATIYQYSNFIRLPNHRLTHLVSIKAGAHHGQRRFSKEIENGLFGAEKRKARIFCEQTGYPLIVIDTNLREILNGIRLAPLRYDATHTFRNCGAILLLQNYFGKYYYADGVDINKFKIDILHDCAYYEKWFLPLLSTDSLKFYSTGLGKGRFEKTKLISNYSPTYDTLHVCWHKEENCGHCNKCIRTLVALDILGALEKYHNVFDLDDYRKNREKILHYVISRREKDSFFLELYQNMPDDMKFSKS